MPKNFRRLALGSAARAGPRRGRQPAAPRRDHRTGPREGERRDLHQDRPRAAAGRRHPGPEPQRQAGGRQERRGAAQGARRGHAAGGAATRSTSCCCCSAARSWASRSPTSSSRRSSRNIRKENKLESEEQFLAALKQEGLTLPDLRRSIERQMIVNRVQQQDVMDKISVTEVGVRGLLRRAQGSSSRRRRRSRCARSWSRCPTGARGRRPTPARPASTSASTKKPR